MTHDMDLNTAAARLESHIRGWRADGLWVSDVQWTPDGAHLAVQVASASWQVWLHAELRRGSRASLFFFVSAETDGTEESAELGRTQVAQERRRVDSLDAWSALLDEAVYRASRTRVRQARLVAASCTTGWLDWIHGELWLLPDCLLRVRSGFVDTLTNSFGSGLTARDSYRFITHDPETVLAAHSTNKLIPFADMARARLHGGVTTSGLEVTMTDGTRHKLLWMSSEPARRLLRERLLPLLGPRLTH
ncbi:hypothetical protein [Streptomyces turgidiscabies]|uniref:Uncharacterized protein n=1 Tax=Streptomyces turgidiscabies TaxID=85558 RepID=A0ABU0REG1_9ACTN|nr:hypothetical protein [Streptomyces turgidiscabies]MDQ0930381.1 hypothetical protein [Streptomyces turgidiscabies]